MRKLRSLFEWLTIVFSVLLIWAAAASIVHGQNGNYYVSPTGSDANTGTITAPWRSITHAALNSHVGDKVWVLTTVATRNISLGWDPVSGATGYNIYRTAIAGGTFPTTPLNGSTPILGTYYTDKTAPAGVNYYMVRATNAGVESPDSLIVKVIQ